MMIVKFYFIINKHENICVGVHWNDTSVPG